MKPQPFIALPCALCLSSAAVTSAQAQVDPLSGIDFVTIGAPGNAAWMGDGTEDDESIGRGAVDYTYRIGRLEVTSAQWCEFFNAALDRPDGPIPHVLDPAVWGGGQVSAQNPGGRRWATSVSGGMLPAGGITWRTAAIYCNWLCNGKSMDRSAFLSGAYDVSTFGYTGPFGDIFTDQATHNPNAQYWIPTGSELLKAFHHDPNKQNPDGSMGGWWTRSNGTNGPLVYGPPGVGQVNAGFESPNPFSIPLGAYPDTMSPWGLLDAAGGTREWTEEIFTNSVGVRSRWHDGSNRGDTATDLDMIYQRAGGFPSDPFSFYGFRIASSIPSPGAAPLVVGLTLIATRRRRIA